jgi:DNA (cytosine-5)-methyltransferase 1
MVELSKKKQNAYYNENNKFAAEWLRNLIKEGLIAYGEVDERSIVEVRPGDLRGYVQCHFFAGIGGWSRALRLAGVPDDFPCWTGSCPCQPFSSAGKQQGFADERHLWPVWERLIRECRPERILGEQVAAAVGKDWLDLVCSGLEAEGYACGAAVLGAHSVGAPHIRQRLYWVADSQGGGRLREREDREATGGLSVPCTGGPAGGFWCDCEWLLFAGGKTRPVEPGTFPLAYGVPQRVGQLRAYGNAIVPQTAAAFVKAYLESVR